MVLSASGSHAILTRNVAAITMDLHGMENVNIRALGSSDNIVVGDLRGTDVDQVHVDLSGTNGGDDGAADTVTVALTADDDALGFAVGTSVINGLGAQVFVDNQGVGDRFVIDGGAGTDTVTANGTGGDDTIGIAFDGTGVAVFTPGSPAISVTDVEQLLVKGGDGNDTIAGQNGIAALTNLTIDGGTGNDTLLGGDGNDVLLGGSGDDFVDGNRGNDTANLGAGDDVFGWDPGDGSDVVEGNGGTDTLQFNGSNIGEDMALSANGSHAILTRNVGAITMDLHGMEVVNIRTLGGADNVTIGDLRGTDVKQVNVDLSSATGGGDTANDVVTIEGTSNADVIHLSMQNGALVVDGLAAQVVVQNFEAGDQIHVVGLGGDDIIDASALPAGASIVLDGGEGDDVVLGGDGNDMLLGGAGDDVLIGGPGQDVLDGGTGDNILIQDGGNALFNADVHATDVVDHAPLTA
jgi:Ca2+-binding RTX toxin-like protein